MHCTTSIKPCCEFSRRPEQCCTVLRRARGVDPIVVGARCNGREEIRRAKIPREGLDRENVLFRAHRGRTSFRADHCAE